MLKKRSVQQYTQQLYNNPELETAPVSVSKNVEKHCGIRPQKLLCRTKEKARESGNNTEEPQRTMPNNKSQTQDHTHHDSIHLSSRAEKTSGTELWWRKNSQQWLLQCRVEAGDWLGWGMREFPGVENWTSPQGLGQTQNSVNIHLKSVCLILCKFYYQKKKLNKYCCYLVAKLCPSLHDTMDCSPPGSSVHGISQARILECIAISFSRGYSWPSVEPLSPASRRILYCWLTREAQTKINSS